MTISHGKQVCIDYSHCDFIEQEKHGTWMLNLMQFAVKSAGVREVHAHVEEFDGTSVSYTHLTLPTKRIV